MSVTSRAGSRLRFYTDPGEFLAEAGAYLAAAPVVSTVVTTVTHHLLAQRMAGGAPSDRDWWLVVQDASGAVAGVAMRTAPFPPHPAFLLPMPDDAAVGLAHALHERGEEVRAVNGTLPAVRLFAETTAELTGGRVEVAQHSRLHELGTLTWPRAVPGELVAATEDDIELAVAWYRAFQGDADEQAGRRRGASFDVPAREEVLGRVRAGRLWFWRNDAGDPVHMTGANPPVFGVARIGPVYTPPAHRGRGWASNAVAGVSHLLQAEGARVCLFTDQANPHSNKIYAALGYRPVVDTANLVIGH